MNQSELPPELERKPKDWQKQFLALAQEIHPDYEKNRLVKSQRVEFLRPIGQHLYVSHSYFHRSSYYEDRSRHDFHHCFALTLTRLSKFGFIEYPMFIGSRFDQAPPMAQLFKDAGLDHKQIHATHAGRTGTTELVRRTMRLAEHNLLPIYIKELRRRKSFLIELIDLAVSIIDHLHSNNVDVTVPPAASPQVDTFMIKFPTWGYQIEEWEERPTREFHVLKAAADVLDLPFTALVDERPSWSYASSPNRPFPAGPSASVNNCLDAVFTLNTFFEAFERDRADLPAMKASLEQL